MTKKKIMFLNGLKSESLTHKPSICLALALALMVSGISVRAQQPETVVTSFVSFTTNSGYNPSGTLLQNSDGSFYGTLQYGGANSNGAIYRVTSGGNLSVVFSFSSTNGSDPASGVIRGSDGNLYGSTVYGGAYVNSDPEHLGFGTVFQFNTNTSVLNILTSLNGSQYASPNGLLETTPGNFYGTANSGGSTSNQFGFTAGGLFEVNTNGALSNVYSFSFTDGANPSAPLIRGTNGLLYGTTTYGGQLQDGTAFQLNTTNDNLSTVFSFSETNGSGPIVLVLGRDGNFYGTTLFGGAYHYGTIFQLTPSHVLNTIAVFNGTNGYSPSSLIQGADGYLYGTTLEGGSIFSTSNNAYGTVFKLSTNGALTSLYSFSGGSDGYSPNSLMQASNGNFYGTTSYGGSAGRGNVFTVSLINPPIVTVSHATNHTITISWTATAGIQYAVEFANNLPAQNNWSILQYVTPTNSMGSATDTVNVNSHRYYRVVAAVTPIGGD